MLFSVSSLTIPPMSQLSSSKVASEHRYKAFAKAYMGKALRSATRAAIMVGYTEASAPQQGNYLIRHPNVRRFLRLEAERIARKVEVGPEQVIAELGKLAFANVADYTDDSGRFVGMDALARDQSAAISELVIDEERRTDGRSGAKRKRKTANATTVTRTKIKLAKKEVALELLGKHWNLFGDNDGGTQTAVKVIVLNSPRPALDALEEAKRIAALPDDDRAELPTRAGHPVPEPASDDDDNPEQ